MEYNHKTSNSHPWEFHPNSGCMDDSYCPECGAEIWNGKYLPGFKDKIIKTI
jgi:hypothetical protein